MVMILVPASQNVKFQGGPKVGCVEAHEEWLRDNGGVFWRLIAPGRRENAKLKRGKQIKMGYFYIPRPIMKVKYRFIIEDVINIDVEEFPPEYNKYVPDFRIPHHINEGFLILIKDIIHISDHLLSEFHKNSDGMPVRRVQNYVLIRDLILN